MLHNDLGTKFSTTKRNTLRYRIILLFISFSFVVFVLVLTEPLGMGWPQLQISLRGLLLLLILFATWLELISGPAYWNMGWKNRIPRFAFAILGVTGLIGVRLVLPSGIKHFRSALEVSIAAISLSLLILPIVVYPYPRRLFISRRRAHWRNIRRSPRQDEIRIQVSPLIKPVRFTTDWWHRLAPIQRLREISPLTLLLLYFVLFAAAVCSLDFLITGKIREVSYYLSVGPITGLIAALVYLIRWFIRTRPKHLVLPFEIVNSGKIDLQPASHIVTHAFVEELQRIGRLLEKRQVEIASVGYEAGLTGFATTNPDQDLVQQFQSLGDLQVAPGLSIPMGNLLAMLSTRLARSTVRGYIQLREDNTLTIWAELSSRRGQALSVGTVTVPSHNTEQPDEQSLRDKAAELAQRLTLRRGDTTYFASTLDSLRYFLTGLDASHNDNWWYAISNYRRALHIEESERGTTFGLGHYHLGAALLFQGDYQDGLTHLRMARRTGPPMPETHYMEALANVYLDSDKLDQEHTFDYIEQGLKTACRLRQDFPEAYHLWGMIYYWRGRLLEERMLSGIERNGSPSLREKDSYFYQARQNYHAAHRLLGKALPLYRRAYMRFRRKHADPRGLGSDELRRIMADIMTVTHKLGDTLRIQQFYSEADSYYDDVIEAYPCDVRTLLDRAKTYCLAQNWEKAYSYLKTRVLRADVALWQPEANLYMAWTQIGGAIAEPRVSFEDARDLMSSGFALLDYAITADPRLIWRWRETDWLPSIITLACVLSGKEPAYQRFRSIGSKTLRLAAWALTNGINDLRRVARNDFDYLKCQLVGSPAWSRKSGLRAPVDRQSGPYWAWVNDSAAINDLQTPQGQLNWLAWRVDSLSFNSLPHNRDSHKRDLILDFCTARGSQVPAMPVPAPEFEGAYSNLKKIHRKVDCLVRWASKIRQKEILGHDWHRLSFVDNLKNEWAKLKASLEGYSAGASHNPELPERWTVDLFLEYSLLMTRLLVETKVYGQAIQIADDAVSVVGNWIKQLPADSQTASIDNPYGLPDWLSPKILYFQLTTLQWWRATALLDGCYDPFTEPHFAAMPENPRPSTSNIMAMQRLLKSAAKEAPFIPFAEFIEAKIHSSLDFHAHAVDRLLKMTETMSAFDPHVYIASWSHRHKTSSTAEQEVHVTLLNALDDGGSSALEDCLAGQVAPNSRPLTDLQLKVPEALGGLKQFTAIMDRASIHALIAEILDKQGKTDLAIRHIQSAIVWSEYIDLDAEYFWRLASYLRRLNRPHEALAAVQEVKARLLSLGNVPYSRVLRARIEEGYLHEQLDQLSRAIAILDPLLDLPLVETTLEQLVSAFQPSNSVSQNSQQLLEKAIQTSGSNLNRWGFLAKRGSRIEMLSLPENPSSGEEWMAWRVAASITKEAEQIVQQWSRLANNLAYALAELHIRLHEALALAEEALNLSIRSGQISFNANKRLYRTLGQTLLKAPLVIPSDDRYVAFEDDNNVVHALECVKPEHRETLARQLDTRGWVNYRLDQFDCAIDDGEKACYLYPEEPIFHLHLTRAYLARIDREWQEKSQQFVLRYLLHQARYHCQFARQFDRNEQLQPEIARLWDRVSDYTKTWGQLQEIPHSGSFSHSVRMINRRRRLRQKK